MTMNPEVKAMWLEALRSGKYKQARNRLKNGNRFCCLGVLCDLCPLSKWEHEAGDELYFGEAIQLPIQVQEWAGVNSADPRVKDERLSQHNDNGKRFKTIADLIEEYL